MPINVSLHVAFQVALSDLHDAPAKLQNAGIQPRDFFRPPDRGARRAGLDACGCGLIP